MNEGFEIYYSDLNDESQRELLEFFGIKDPKEMNWDVVPLATIYDEDLDK